MLVSFSFMNKFKILAILGMIAPISYTLLWIIAGWIVPGYDHVRDDVSSLYAVNAYMRWFFQIGFLIGGVLLFVFYTGLHKGMNGGEGSIVGPLLMMISSGLGVIVEMFFPLDEGGEIITWRGKGHLIIIVISGIIGIAGMGFLWIRAKKLDGWVGFGWFTFASAIICLILVGVNMPYAGTEVMGLVERFMVSYYQIFYFVNALWVFIRN